MRFPKLRPQGAKTLKVPDLAGGINLRDGISEVLDTQLTQATNVWYQDGLLKTRPGVSAVDEIFIGRTVSEQKVSYKMWSNVKYKYNDQEYVLAVVKRDEDADLIGKYTTVLKPYWKSIVGSMPIEVINFDEEITYFATQDNDSVYLYTSNFEIYKLDLSEGNNFVKVEEEDIYVPTIATNCRRIGGLAGATMVEGFNIIGKRCKLIYSTVNIDELDPNNKEDTHFMEYEVPYLNGEEMRELILQFMEVRVTNAKGETTTHTLDTYEETGETMLYHETSFNKDDLRLELYADKSKENSNSAIILFHAKNETDFGAEVKASEYIPNNMEVIIPVLKDRDEYKKVFGATQCEWFGGAAEGIAGGTRLFLCDNTNENKNLVVWSDLNNPLYFPENNYFRVGESSSAVKGFGKQSDMLVIFKENGCGVYYTKYQQNTEISGEDLINQSVIDYTASSVYFPLVQINPNVGCSYPETIQLCRNRLVWLGDNGNVFTLVNENQYNERSVFCVSEMVRRDLKKNVSVIPTACDWNGYYCLMCDNKLYLMDYNCYGYTHVASYSKTEDANVRIPWYIWELPFEASMCESDGCIIFTRYNDGESYAECVALSYVLSLNNESADWVFTMYDDKDMSSGDNLAKRPIQTVLRTKLFTFGEASVRKSVDKINLQLGNNGGEPIAVKVITDQSEEEHDIYLTGTETEAYTPAYIDSKAIFPTARNFLRVGVELSSEGVIAVDGMEFKFRTLGGAR